MRAWSINILLLSIVLLAGGKLRAQTEPVFSQSVDTTGEIPRFGPNRLFFGHGIFTFGMFEAPQYGMPVRWWSPSISDGARMKLKLWSWDALVFDINYRYDLFSIKDSKPKLAPLDPMKHVRDRISVNNFSGGIANRFTLGRFGNVMGWWLDLGVYGDWAFYASHTVVDEYYNSNSPDGYGFKVKTRMSRLPYMSQVNYGVTARIGGDYVGLFVRYRLNKQITGSYGPYETDLPALTIGIELYQIEE